MFHRILVTQLNLVTHFPSMFFNLYLTFSLLGAYFRVKDRVVRVPPGYQAELVIQLLWVDGEPPQQITSLDINSAYGLYVMSCLTVCQLIYFSIQSFVYPVDLVVHFS